MPAVAGLGRDGVGTRATAGSPSRQRAILGDALYAIREAVAWQTLEKARPALAGRRAGNPASDECPGSVSDKRIPISAEFANRQHQLMRQHRAQLSAGLSGQPNRDSSRSVLDFNSISRRDRVTAVLE